MNKPYFDISELYTREYREAPPEHLAKLFTSLQKVVDQAYQDGYEACLRANLFGEDIHNEQEKS